MGMKLENIEIIVNTDYSLHKSTIGWKAKYDGLLYGDFISLNEPTPSVAKVIEATNVLLKQAISVCEQLENESTPTADVAEVRHEEWIENEDDFWVMCSDCGTEIWDEHLGVISTFKYCPFCGAKMDGERNKSNE